MTSLYPCLSAEETEEESVNGVAKKAADPHPIETDLCLGLFTLEGAVVCTTSQDTPEHQPLLKALFLYFTIKPARLPSQQGNQPKTILFAKETFQLHHQPLLTVFQPRAKHDQDLPRPSESAGTPASVREEGTRRLSPAGIAASRMAFVKCVRARPTVPFPDSESGPRSWGRSLNGSVVIPMLTSDGEPRAYYRDRTGSEPRFQLSRPCNRESFRSPN
uniref:uncharacterized protein LOC132695025 n=1 Tax=Panthera onca TaxID=9690 RepID=UPI002953F6B2|nr:uncharacterized protein LOC132695025 [Panthera onca]